MILYIIIHIHHFTELCTHVPNEIFVVFQIEYY